MSNLGTVPPTSQKIFKKTQTHLNQLIKVFRATLLQTGVLKQGWNLSLQEGSSPEAGL